MDALDPAAGLSPEACTLCMDCVDFCPQGIVKFGLKRPEGQPRPVDLTRRSVLAGIAAGAAIPGVALAARLGFGSPPAPYLLRPPGAAADEKTFLSLCIRCGECMKVCPTNVLQPTIFEAGLEGIFSPRLAPRLIFEQSGCTYTCTLCGQVCPTGAIPRLTEQTKHDRPIGYAYFDHALCLPWAEGTPCIRCEEMCPTPEKAIKILNTFTIKGEDGEDVEIQQPYVDRDLCIGCGLCETNCPVEGTSAIRVQRVESPDPGTEFLLG
jgi:ferredoxin